MEANTETIDRLAQQETAKMLRRRSFAALENIVELVLATPGVTAEETSMRLRELADYIEERA